MKKLIIALLAITFSACAHNPPRNKWDECVLFCPKNEMPKLIQSSLVALKDVPPPKRKVTVAVYDFPALTGQRKDKDSVASFSTAVTQGGTAILIDALKNAGDGQWFTVVERNRIDDLAKERQIIRQTRDEYEGKDSNKLDPMLFAGIVLQGGIIGYDSKIGRAHV